MDFQDTAFVSLRNQLARHILSLPHPLPLENKTTHADTFLISDTRRNKSFDARGTTQIKNKTNTNNLN